MIQVNVIIFHFHPFRTQQLGLHVDAAEGEGGCEPSLAVDDSVAGNDSGARIDVKRPTDLTACPRTSYCPCNIAVTNYFALRHCLYKFVDCIKKVIHNIHNITKTQRNEQSKAHEENLKELT